MLQEIIFDTLMNIIRKTYPDKQVPSFWLEVHSKEMASKHGDYWPAHKKIRIFNLSRKTEYIITTGIHEAAHHVEYIFYGDTGHSKRFYGVYKELLETAIKMGIVNYEEARKVADARDINSLERYYGRLTASYDPAYDDKKDVSMIKVFNCYPIKDTLKSRGYRYNGIEQAWCKEMNNTQATEEKEFLKSLIDEKNIVVSEGNIITIEAVYYVVVDNCYNCKDVLKSNGYIYKGYNQKGNSWVKKIKANTLEDEQKFLKQFPGIKVQVKGNK